MSALTHVSDVYRDGRTVWVMRHEDGRAIAIVNPRPEMDHDGDNRYVAYRWDAIEVDGLEATDDERDELESVVRDVLRDADRAGHWS